MSEESQPKKNYKDSLNLPKTDFPMEAKLVQNEPARLKKWQEGRLYEKLLANRAQSTKGKWILHDGPPFANGDIHIGHVVNKTLKDVILRFRTMQGYFTPYVPGWDCHGLPIEHKIQEKLKGKIREMTPVEVRKHCYDYAAEFAAKQAVQFQRMGILGEWENPYLTMKGEYEASTLEVFAKFVEQGLVYKQLKPVPWSVSSQTALADAELEYQDVEDPSVFVEMTAVDSLSVGQTFLAAQHTLSKLPSNAPISFIIWTTTPWTLPANLAIAAHPEVEYSLVDYTRAGKKHLGVVAADLVDRVFKDRRGVESFSVLATVKGEALLHSEYRHPFVNRVGKILPADYVTTTDGTGLVHTAPGHGEDDYNTGIANGLEVYCPVQANGRFDDTVPDWLKGQQIWEANPVIIQKLTQLDVLFDEVKITHSYPHDWRTKKPVIQRATEQWFIAIDKPFSLAPSPGAAGEGSSTSKTDELSLRQRGQVECESSVKFVPDWGAARIQGMLKTRPDWCVSRQRAWGLPIPVFYNEKGEALLTKESVLAVSTRFREHGSDAWFNLSPKELLGYDFAYPAGFDPDTLRKEKDIFDVWFESGSSWHAVLQARSYLHFPADLYLEGSDQHRGWFQLSMLPSLGFNGCAPFKSVLTHGFIVKPDGKKVSKSDKEYVTAMQEIERHGADLIRLWCCSVDYQHDIPASPQVIKDFGDKYRKIRNTLRYLLSNLADFNPHTDAVEIPASSLDGWASNELDQLTEEVTAAYDRYELHRVFRLLHDFCSVQISAMYGNAMKDRLYCEVPASPLRRRCQTVMYRMLVALTKLLSPMIVFTADEAWEYILHKPHDEANLESVHLAHLPVSSRTPGALSEAQEQEWRIVMELRDQALSQLDKITRQVIEEQKARGEKTGYKALDAEVIFAVDDADLRRRLEAWGVDLADMVGAGYHSFVEKDTPGPAVEVKVVDRRDKYKACARSWRRRPDVGLDPQYPDLSLRDAQAVRASK